MLHPHIHGGVMLTLRLECSSWGKRRDRNPALRILDGLRRRYDPSATRTEPVDAGRWVWQGVIAVTAAEA